MPVVLFDEQAATVAAVERAIDDWGDLIASMARTRALIRKAIDASNDAIDAINADRAARGLPPISDSEPATVADSEAVAHSGATPPTPRRQSCESRSRVAAYHDDENGPPIRRQSSAKNSEVMGK